MASASKSSTFGFAQIASKKWKFGQKNTFNWATKYKNSKQYWLFGLEKQIAQVKHDHLWAI